MCSTICLLIYFFWTYKSVSPHHFWHLDSLYKRVYNPCRKPIVSLTPNPRGELNLNLNYWLIIMWRNLLLYLNKKNTTLTRAGTGDNKWIFFHSFEEFMGTLIYHSLSHPCIPGKPTITVFSCNFSLSQVTSIKQKEIISFF